MKLMDEKLMGNFCIRPADIERRSFEIIGEELAGHDGLPARTPLEDCIVRRVIHTSADFDFAGTLAFTHGAAEAALSLLRSGTDIVTDTMMAKSGINKTVFAALGGAVHCFMADADVAAAAKRDGVTRATASVDKAAALAKPLVFAIGNAPTALLRIHDLLAEGALDARLVIAAPVGFVNVVEAKELFLTSDVPCIIARGRKGGSAVAAAIVNALLYFKGDDASLRGI
jgi:precorrin-8X/cobalt-precorrin-8 methylmutase